MKRIPLTQGKFALVDDEDYEELSKHKWCARKDGNRWYAAQSIKRNKKWTTLLMHRVIMKPPKRVDIDHRNHNGLDNRQYNLRMCSRTQNMQNGRAHKDSISKFCGVSWSKVTKKWQVHIRHNHKGIYLGLFDDEVEAAKIYDRKARELFGEFAYPNF